VFFERMKVHFTLPEIALLAHCVMWYGGVHKVNGLFDIEPSSGVLEELRSTIYADPAAD
jgi:hypothetical protein